MLAARIDPPEPRRSEEGQNILRNIEEQKDHLGQLMTMYEGYMQEYAESFSDNTLYTGDSRAKLGELVECLQYEVKKKIDMLNLTIDSLESVGGVWEGEYYERRI